MLGHNGQFGNFLKEVREQGGMQAPLMDQTGLPLLCSASTVHLFTTIQPYCSAGCKPSKRQQPAQCDVL